MLSRTPIPYSGSERTWRKRDIPQTQDDKRSLILAIRSPWRQRQFHAAGRGGLRTLNDRYIIQRKET